MRALSLSLAIIILMVQLSFAGDPNFSLWEAFFEAPTQGNYEAVKNHIAVSLSDKGDLYETSVWKEFTAPYRMIKFYKLIEEGNNFAVDLAFEALPIISKHANIPEALAESTSKAFNDHPEIILKQIMKRNESCGWASYISVDIDSFEQNRDIMAKKIAILRNISSVELVNIKESCLSDMLTKLSSYEEFIKAGKKP